MVGWDNNQREKKNETGLKMSVLNSLLKVLGVPLKENNRETRSPNYPASYLTLFFYM